MSALKGIRIIELARVSPAAFCTRMLSDFGAEVIKIHSTQEVPAEVDDKILQRARFSPYERNKRSIAVNLKSSEGRNVLRKLIATADVVVDGFRPGVLGRQGLGYDSLKADNEKLIYCAMTSFGQSGPDKDIPGHDLNFLAYSGVLGLIGEKGGSPVMPLNLVGDYAGGTMHAIMGILLALFSRTQTGRGQLVDIAYMDSCFSLLSATNNMRDYFRSGFTLKRGEGVFSGVGPLPHYSIYETADGEYLSIGCTEPGNWKGLMEALDLSQYAGHTLNLNHRRGIVSELDQKIRAEVQQKLMQKTRDEWVVYFKDKNVCAAPVNSVEEAISNPQLKSRDMVVEIDDQQLGPVKQVGQPVKLSETPAAIHSGGPVPGEHGNAVLAELDITEAEIETLRAAGAIA